MDGGVRPIPCIKSTHLSLQIIITILTIILLFFNFHEFVEYNIVLIIEIIINLIILIVVITSPLFVDNHMCYLCILGPCWFASNITGLINSSFLSPNELLGIYKFALYVRTFLIFIFFVISGFNHEKGMI